MVCHKSGEIILLIASANVENNVFCSGKCGTIWMMTCLEIIDIVLAFNLSLIIFCMMTQCCMLQKNVFARSSVVMDCV